MGRWLSLACFPRQPRLEETSCLLLLLLGSPFVCPVLKSELLSSPFLQNSSAHREIPLPAHSHIPNVPAPCCVCAPIPISLLVTPSPYPVPSSPLWSGSDRVHRVIGSQRTGAPKTHCYQHPLPRCPLCS